jgi:hypothetical protein
MTTPRKRKPRPPDTCRLVLQIRGESYRVRPVRPLPPGVVRTWKLRKGSGTTYTVAESPRGSTCDCGDFTYRRGGDSGGCKHVRATRAVGLIEPGP